MRDTEGLRQLLAMFGLGAAVITMYEAGGAGLLVAWGESFIVILLSAAILGVVAALLYGGVCYWTGCQNEQ